MNTKMFTHGLCEQDNCQNVQIKDAHTDYNGRCIKISNSSGALLDMLAEVASRTLHSDPSVKNSSNSKKQASSRNWKTKSCNKKKRVVYRGRENVLMDLDYIRTLTGNHLIKLFSEFDGDEMKKMFTFKCFLEPEHCHEYFSSFGSEGKARQQMKAHLLEHIQRLEEEVKYGKKFTIEPVKVRHRRLVDQNVNSLHVKKKINVKCPEKTMAGSNENDSSLPNKETVKSVVDEFKPIKVESTDIEMPLNVNKIEFSNCMINVSCTPKDEENIKSNSNTNNIIYSEHSYTTFGLKCSESSIVSPHDRVVDMPVKKYIEDPAVEVCLHSDSGTFVAAETLCDMIMVCVVDNCTSPLPSVGQEIDIETCPSQPVNQSILETDVTDAFHKSALSKDSYDTKSDSRKENHKIERDEHRQKKKPKGKAKFIGQSKAEKEMAIQMIDSMKRKDNVVDSLECRICVPPRTFTAPTTLISHYRSHAGIKPYECRICRSVFTRQHSLNYHMLIHTNQTRFTCADCGRKFRHPSHFKEHRRRHTGESPYECSDCMLRFKTRNTYKRHLKTRHGKVLTTTGALIMLSEEEFRRVRTLPRSLNNCEFTERNSLRKGCQKTVKYNIRDKTDESLEDYANDSQEQLSDSEDIRIEEYIENSTNEANNCTTKIDSESTRKCGLKRHVKFEDIVQEAIGDTDIPFTNYIEQSHNINLTDVSDESDLVIISKAQSEKAVNSRSSAETNWDNVNIHMNNNNEQRPGYLNTMFLKGNSKCITQLLPKPSDDPLIIPHSLSFSPGLMDTISEPVNTITSCAHIAESMTVSEESETVVHPV